jgi:hypothetical protein
MAISWTTAPLVGGPSSCLLFRWNALDHSFWLGYRGRTPVWCDCGVGHRGAPIVIACPYSVNSDVNFPPARVHRPFKMDCYFVAKHVVGPPDEGVGRAWRTLSERTVACPVGWDKTKGLLTCRHSTAFS